MIEDKEVIELTAGGTVALAKTAYLQGSRATDRIEPLANPHAKQIEIWHNILWSRYKGEVFSALWNCVDRSEFALRFIQIAETDVHRASLSGVDMSRHQYPFQLLFRGSFRNVALIRRIWATVSRAATSTADLTILSGYERLECWLHLMILVLRRRKVALFLDSTINDRPQRFWTGALKALFFKGVQGVFGYGIRSKEYATHYGMAAERVFIPCLTAALPSDYQPAAALKNRRMAEIQEGAPKYLYVGRLSKEKGLDVLLTAFENVRARCATATLTIVGDGDRRAALMQTVSKRGLGASVSFTGSKTGEELYQEFTRATALVLPSFSEPWGLVVNEAFAYGCPAIVSDRCGCVPELLIEGITGFVHRAGDAVDLAEKMRLAPRVFGNTAVTAANCMQAVASYTPSGAARSILDGCRHILRKPA